MPRRRLGVVLLIPDPVRREIDGLRRALGDRSLGRVAPHLTLVPPVNVADEQLDVGLELLRRAGAALAPFDLMLGPAATFHPATPTVYLAVGGDVGSVHRVRDLVFSRPFSRRLDHAFVPHVTIADDLPIDRISAAMEAIRHYQVEVAVDRLHLLEETRLADGRRVWEPLADVGFGPPAVIGRGGLELTLSVSELVPPDAMPMLGGLLVTDPVPPEGRPGRGVVVTGRRGREVVGLAAGWALGGLGHLEVVAVGQPFRREGVGSHLVAHFESSCAERGCFEMVGVSPHEPAMLALLARRGWARQPERVGDRDDPVRLRRRL
jgi:2'-5' RNA ligase/GNAT superfamily N-acetyltransferase